MPLESEKLALPQLTKPQPILADDFFGLSKAEGHQSDVGHFKSAYDGKEKEKNKINKHSRPGIHYLCCWYW